jgi:hypothetical protein
MNMKILTAGAGLAALAAAAPLSAQYGGYYQPYGNTYANPYVSPYASPYGNTYNNANLTQLAVNQCTAAVQARLNNRVGVQSILGAVLGTNTRGRVLSISQVTPRSNTVRVRGFASSGRMAYNPYGYGYYGAVGSQYAAPADLAFKCDVDYRGRVRDIDLNRR